MMNAKKRLYNSNFGFGDSHNHFWRARSSLNDKADVTADPDGNRDASELKAPTAVGSGDLLGGVIGNESK